MIKTKEYRRRIALLFFILISILLITLINFIFFNYLSFIINIKNSFIPSYDYEFQRIKEPVYIMPYLGDIDGEVSNDWFFFYDKITDYYTDNKIPVTFSFYPGSMGDDEDFDKVFLKMYESENIELMQKSYKGDDSEREMYKLPMEKQREIVSLGQEIFKQKMRLILEKNKENTDVQIPTSYNQITGRINNDTRTALESLGFNMYFDMFVEELAPVESTETFDVIEYGVSFTDTGGAGKERDFKSPLKISIEINNFDREDVTVMNVNGRKVIPIWAHQQDFESQEEENKLDKEKWNIYVFTMNKLKKEPNVIFITPRELYEMRHKGIELK